MGDVAWPLATLAVATALITYLVKWILTREKELRQSLREEVERERGIAASWRQVGEASLANDRRAAETMDHMMSNQRRGAEQLAMLAANQQRMMAMLENAFRGGTTPWAGERGWSGFEENRRGPSTSHRMP